MRTASVNEADKRPHEDLLKLEEISREYEIMLLDTCVLQTIARTMHGHEKIHFERESANFYRRHIEERGTNIYLTEEVMKEYAPSGEGYLINEEVINSLIKCFKREGRIVFLSDEEEEKYESVKEGYLTDPGMSAPGEVDISLLAKAGVISGARKKTTCLVSNDMPLLGAWKHLLKKKEFLQSN